MLIGSTLGLCCRHCCCTCETNTSWRLWKVVPWVGELSHWSSLLVTQTTPVHEYTPVLRPPEHSVKWQCLLFYSSQLYVLNAAKRNILQQYNTSSATA